MWKLISHFVAQLATSLLLLGCGQIAGRQPAKTEDAPSTSAVTEGGESSVQTGQSVPAISFMTPDRDLGGNAPETVAVRANAANTPDASAEPPAKLIDDLATLADDDEGAKMLCESLVPLSLESSLWRPAENGERRNSSAASGIRALVRRGVAALPELLRHVDDRRPTQIAIRQMSPLGSLSRSNWFDPRFRSDEQKHPAGIAASEVESTVVPDWGPVYAVTVGDVCYFVIGQVVNRDLRIVHRRMTQAILITSPTASPELASAIRSDWSGITATDHCQSLAADARQWIRPGDAIQRLVSYYPDEVEDVALELLQRPLYFKSPTFELLVDLLKTGDLGDWNSLIDDFREKYGDSMEADIQSGLQAAASRQPRKRESDWDVEHRKRASRILAKFYPTFDSRSAPSPTHSTYAIQASIVLGLRGSPASDKLDAAIYQVFTEANAAAFQHESVRQDLDLLAIACVHRLKGSRYDTSLLDFIEKRISATDEPPQSLAEKSCLQEFRSLRASMQERK